MTEKNKKRFATKNKRVVKYPGIRPVSRELGVTPSHLWKVLEGHRIGRAGLINEFWMRSKQHSYEQSQNIDS